MGCPSAGWLRLGGNTKQWIGREIFLRAVQLRVVALNSPRKVRCRPVLCRICQSLILDCIFGFAIFGERILSAAFQRLAIHEASVDASVPNANKLLWPRLFSLADQVVVPSSATRDVMLSLRIPGQRITLTPYCVDNVWWIPESDKVDRTRVRAAWRAGPSTSITLVCAKLQPWKDLWIFRTRSPWPILQITSGLPRKLDTPGNHYRQRRGDGIPRRMWDATKSILTGLLVTRLVESTSVFNP
jgi:hypothetical protein